MRVRIALWRCGLIFCIGCVQIRSCRIPAVSSCDLTLHLIFLIAIVILFVSGAFTVIGFISNHAKITSQVPRDSLSQEDVVVLVGGLTFFIAFIIALLTQIRASQSLYKLIVSCISSNTEWRIDPYRHSDDSLYRKWCASSLHCVAAAELFPCCHFLLTLHMLPFT